MKVKHGLKFFISALFAIVVLAGCEISAMDAEEISSGFCDLIGLEDINEVDYGSDNMSINETILNFSKLIESEGLENISLTIYYFRFFAFIRGPVLLEDLIDWRYDYKFTVTGVDLADYIELFSKLDDVELIPTKNKNPLPCARFYYVFEHEEHGELFAFLSGGVFDGRDTIFVNGVEVEFNSIFFEVAFPFLPYDIVTGFEGYIRNVLNQTADE